MFPTNSASMSEATTPASAIADAGVVASDIEALFVGNMIGAFTEGQYHLAYVLSQWTGLSIGNDAWRPAVRVDGACASSSHAIRSAVFEVASGAYDIVPVSYTTL